MHIDSLYDSTSHNDYTFVCNILTQTVNISKILSQLGVSSDIIKGVKSSADILRTIDKYSVMSAGAPHFKTESNSPIWKEWNAKSAKDAHYKIDSTMTLLNSLVSPVGSILSSKMQEEDDGISTKPISTVRNEYKGTYMCYELFEIILPKVCNDIVLIKNITRIFDKIREDGISIILDELKDYKYKFWCISHEKQRSFVYSEVQTLRNKYGLNEYYENYHLEDDHINDERL